MKESNFIDNLTTCHVKQSFRKNPYFDILLQKEMIYSRWLCTQKYRKRNVGGESRRRRWRGIGGPRKGDHKDPMDHKEIRKWARERN